MPPEDLRAPTGRRPAPPPTPAPLPPLAPPPVAIPLNLPPPAAAPPSLPPGTPGRLGEYRIVRLLGEGAMGKVYEAIQESLQRKVALKVLPKDFAQDADAVVRFEREARSAAALHHANIVPVYGSGVDGGLYYYAMEYVVGKSLADLVHAEKDPLRDEKRIAKYILQVALALDYAHGQGVVHRDVKPANIMIRGDDQAVITDFGLARQQQNKAITQVGALMGTPTYMAPEQCLGNPIDHRIDVYALGVTLFECLTGHLPFLTNDLRGLLIMITTQPPPPAAKYRAGVSPDLEAVALRCMEKKPEDRYPTCKELGEDVIRYFRGDVVRARHATFGQILVKKVRKHPGVAALAALLVFVVAGGLLYLSKRAADRRRDAEALVTEARSAEDGGDYKTALAKVNQALGIVPGEPEARRVQGRVEGLLRIAEQRERDAAAAEARAQQAREALGGQLERARQKLEEADRLVGDALRRYTQAQAELTTKRRARDEMLNQGVGRMLQEGATTQVTRAFGEFRAAEDALLRLDGGPTSSPEATRGSLVDQGLDLLREARAVLPDRTVVESTAPDRVALLDEVAQHVSDRSTDLIRVALTRAERHGNREVAATYARALAALGRSEAPVEETTTLEVTTTPPGAQATLYRVVQGSARWQLEPVPVGPDEAGAEPAPGDRVALRRRVVRGAEYVVQLARPGCETIRVPVLAVGVPERVRVQLPRALPAAFPHEMAFVAPGEVYVGGDPDAVRPLSATREPVWVSGFFVARHEVTVEQYVAFLRDVGAEGAQHLPPPDLQAQLTRSPLGAVPGTERQPVAGVRMASAQRYCAWLGQRCSLRGVRLPTDEEWEKAARGPAGRAFPWGNEYDERGDVCLHRSNQFAVVAVGSLERDRSIYDVCDLGGNLSEWIEPRAQSAAAFHGDARFQVLRGGSWARGPEVTRSASREPLDPEVDFARVAHRAGFRVALVPE